MTKRDYLLWGLALLLGTLVHFGMHHLANLPEGGSVTVVR